MSLNLRKWTASGVLALGVCVLAVSSSLSDDKDDDKKAIVAAREDVLKLAAGTGDPRALAKKHMIEHVMRGFKPREKMGIGLGDKPGAIMPDGIESMILQLAKAKPATLKGQLAKDSAALVKGIEVTKAIGDINDFYAPKEKKGDKDPAKWKKFNEDMKAASKNLIEMIKTADPMKVKTAAGKLNQAQ